MSPTTQEPDLQALSESLQVVANHIKYINSLPIPSIHAPLDPIQQSIINLTAKVTDLSITVNRLSATATNLSTASGDTALRLVSLDERISTNIEHAIDNLTNTLPAFTGNLEWRLNRIQSRLSTRMQSTEFNSISRLYNKNNPDDILHPLHAIETNMKIEGFPSTVAEMLQLPGKTSVRIFHVIQYHTNLSPSFFPLLEERLDFILEELGYPPQPHVTLWNKQAMLKMLWGVGI